MSEEILMGRWDCGSCGTKGVLGDDYECDNCGSDRPEDVKFYLPDDAEVITDAKGIADAKAGPDWRCEYCDSWIPATSEDCYNCGGGDIEGNERQVTDFAPAAPIVRTAYHEPHEAPTDVPDVPRFDKLLLSKISIAVGSVLLLLIGIYMFWAQDVPVVVIGHKWTRVQNIEQYHALDKEGWDHPGDAYDVSSSRRLHHYNRVLDHYETKYRNERYTVQQGTKSQSYTERVSAGTERYQSGSTTRSLGNGRYSRTPTYSTRTKYRTVTRTRQVPNYVTKTRRVSYQDPVYKQVPEYRTYYNYRVNRWLAIAARKTSGRNKKPQWPDTSLPIKSGIGALRLGSRSGVYTVDLRVLDRDDFKQYSKSLDYGRWREINHGQRMIARIRIGVVTKLMTEEEAASE